MVIKYYSSATSPPTLLYMGRDKEENEHLIKYGWPEDVWFHVDKLSSAHVYARLQPGQTMEDVPQALIDDCAQLVKANSIEGCKLNNVDIVYTPWANLKKTGEMVTGQVGFKSQKAVKKLRVERKINDIINRLNKTKVVDDEIDYMAERQARDARERQDTKLAERQRRAAEKAEQERQERERAERSYDHVFQGAEMTSNADGYDSDDFM